MWQRVWRFMELIPTFLGTVVKELWCERSERFREAWIPWSGSAESMLNFLYWHGLGRYLHFRVWWTNVFQVGDVNIKKWVRPLPRPARMTVLIVPGLNGDEKAHYVEQFIVEVASARDLDVYVLCGTGVLEYGNTSTLNNVMYVLRQQVQGPIGIIGFSAGGVMCVKYATEVDPTIVRFMASIGGAYNLIAVYHYMPRVWTSMYNWYLGHEDKGRDILQDVRICKRLNMTLEEYYDKNSCHGDVVDTRVPLYICSSFDDPLFPKSQLKGIIDAHLHNPLVKLTITQHGGHLGWRCGKWLNHTYFQEVMQEVLEEAT